MRLLIHFNPRKSVEKNIEQSGKVCKKRQKIIHLRNMATSAEEITRFITGRFSYTIIGRLGRKKYVGIRSQRGKIGKSTQKDVINMWLIILHARTSR